jgi:phosphoribosylformylglycinamidine synthase
MKVRVYVTPKRGVLDPQGVVIERGLAQLGFGAATAVRVGKVIEFELEAESDEAASAEVHAMCTKFLTNPVIEDYRFTLRSES